jgi:hypothetical protein
MATTLVLNHKFQIAAAFAQPRDRGTSDALKNYAFYRAIRVAIVALIFLVGLLKAEKAKACDLSTNHSISMGTNQLCIPCSSFSVVSAGKSDGSQIPDKSLSCNRAQPINDIRFLTLATRKLFYTEDPGASPHINVYLSLAPSAGAINESIFEFKDRRHGFSDEEIHNFRLGAAGFIIRDFRKQYGDPHPEGRFFLLFAPPSGMPTRSHALVGACMQGSSSKASAPRITCNFSALHLTSSVYVSITIFGYGYIGSKLLTDSGFPDLYNSIYSKLQGYIK